MLSIYCTVSDLLKKRLQVKVMIPNRIFLSLTRSIVLDIIHNEFDMLNALLYFKLLSLELLGC